MRILLIQPDKLGDSILCLPALHHLRVSKPDARITMLTRKTNFPLYAGTGLVDELIDCPPAPSLKYALRCLATARIGYDAAICFPRAGARRWLGMAHLCGAKLTIGAPYQRGSLRGNRNIDRCVAMPDIVHDSDRAKRLVSVLTGEPSGPLMYKVAVDLEGAAELLQRNGVLTPYLVVHVNTGGSDPAYPLDKWMQVARGLGDESGLQVVLSGGQDAPIPDLPHPRITNLVGKSTLAQLTGLVASAQAVVSGSTAAVHLASAMGTGVVLVESIPKTDAAYVQFLPYNVPLRHLLVGGDNITPAPEEIVAAALDLLSTGGFKTPFEGLLPPFSERPLPMRF
jgi:ADP-heptose:LPS heptosyltransferase